MIKEKYTQLLLSLQIREITTIGDTHKLATRQKKRNVDRFIELIKLLLLNN